MSIPDPAPAKMRRAARAYHQDSGGDTSPAMGPGPTYDQAQLSYPKQQQQQQQQQQFGPGQFGYAQPQQQQQRFAPGQPQPQQGGFGPGQPHPQQGGFPGQPGMYQQPPPMQQQVPVGGHGLPGGVAHPDPSRIASAGPGGGAPLGNPNGINQPPHHAGQRFQGPRAKIDPDSIPSPVVVQDQDQDYFDKELFLTCGRGGLPLATTDFAAVDQGNATPKFLRLTTYSIPTTDDLAYTSQLPLGLVVQPFAPQRPDEMEVPVVDFGDAGPPRCKKCRGYINPWCLFVEGGMKFVCNLCGGATEVSPEYFCNLDMNGRRVDYEQRLELQRGTIDFRVPKEYWAVQPDNADNSLLLASTYTMPIAPPSPNPAVGADLASPALASAASFANAAAQAASSAATATLGVAKTVVRAPRPLSYFFAIDVSYGAVSTGMLREVITSIREVLYGSKRTSESDDAKAEDNGGEKPNGASMDERYGLPGGSKVAFVTFDRSLHFWNIHPSLDQAQMMVVPDISDVFVPISEGLLVDPWDSREIIENLLDSLPAVFANNHVSEAAFGAAVRGAQAALTHIGGQVNVFLSTIPTIGPGALRHREDTKLYDTDKEKSLFVTQDGFYRGAAEECVEAGIGINAFLFPNQYIDVASIGTLTGLTGGELYFHPRFDPVRDGRKLKSEISRSVLRETAYNCTMRIRCSNGLRVQEHLGNFYQRNVTDIELGNMDADKAVVAVIRHEGKLDEKHEAHFQSAVLYTTAYGERRVRVSNIAVPVSSLLANVFRYADMDAAIAYYAKEVVTQATSKNLREIRNYLTEKCVKILLAYRKNCASSTLPGQLILPESFKLFPLYALAIMKTKAIKPGNVTSDVRAHYMRWFRAAGVAATMANLYPRMIAIHNLADDEGLPKAETGKVKTSPLMRPSYLRMEQNGAYIIENGEIILLWIGSGVSPRLLQDLYGVDNLEELDVRMTSLPKLPTRFSEQVRNIVAAFEAHRQRSLPVLIARQNMDGTEVEFGNSLVEDSNGGNMSYVDYLCYVHKKIQSELTGEKSSEDATSTWRGAW